MPDPVHISKPLAEIMRELRHQQREMERRLREAVERGKKPGQTVKVGVVRKPNGTGSRNT